MGRGWATRVAEHRVAPDSVGAGESDLEFVGVGLWRSADDDVGASGGRCGPATHIRTGLDCKHPSGRVAHHPEGGWQPLNADPWAPHKRVPLLQYALWILQLEIVCR